MFKFFYGVGLMAKIFVFMLREPCQALQVALCQLQKLQRSKEASQLS